MYSESYELDNIVQPGFEELLEGNFELKGKWNQKFFKKDQPIILELGCGKGDYSVALARKYPDYNFIGADIKGDRILRGARTGKSEELENLGFLRIQIQNIAHAFRNEEIDQIWITFPDPQARDRWEHRRMTSPNFLYRYKHILKPNGIIHLKTDSELLYNYTREVAMQLNQEIITESCDVYGDNLKNDATLTQTYYEKKWLAEGKKIFFLEFKLNL